MKQKKKKSYTIQFVHNGKDPAPVLRAMVRETFMKVLERNGATSSNLDEVLEKYIK